MSFNLIAIVYNINNKLQGGKFSKHAIKECLIETINQLCKWILLSDWK